MYIDEQITHRCWCIYCDDPAKPLSSRTRLNLGANTEFAVITNDYKVIKSSAGFQEVHPQVRYVSIVERLIGWWATWARFMMRKTKMDMPKPMYTVRLAADLPDVAHSIMWRRCSQKLWFGNTVWRTVIFVYEISKEECDRKGEHSAGMLNRLVSKDFKRKRDLKQLHADNIRNDKASNKDAAWFRGH